MLVDNLQVEDGYVSPPDKPGLGIEPNEEVLGRYRVE
jgi:L-alanine-DL-glutamate epimerase-like enolase superfamily enzyme